MINPPLQRHPSLQPFSRDHYVGLVQAQRLIKANASSPAKQRRDALAGFLRAWNEEIRVHFDDEERLLLPITADASQRRQLTDEHAELRSLAAEAERLAGAVDVDASWLNRVGALLERHIRWEERELFPAIERTAGAEDIRRLESETAAIEAARPRNACAK
ncbi:MAG: hemerythrin domain-containing protein [Phycisphaerae bacterium]|nr:hemerythrin domain-containing protein [Phycisphaerae bacterium]NUQ48222.1 hemerythrin domain-containing protein [Phycisphaerae bacterium]